MNLNELSIEEYRDKLLITERLVDIESLVPLPDNPKLHADTYIQNLINRYGFISRPLINEPTRHILAGNGRRDNLIRLKKNGSEAPQGVVLKDEKWYILVDMINVPEEDEIPIALALNRSSELGHWDQQILARALAKTPDDQVEHVGFNKELIRAVKAFHGPEEDDPDEWNAEVSAAVSRAPSAGYVKPVGTTASAPSEGNSEEFDPFGERMVDPAGERPDKSVVRYVVMTETARAVHKAVRLAKDIHSYTDPENGTSEALMEIAQFYIDNNEEAD